MEVGKKIKELRIQNSMTLDELSKKSDVSISLLSMIERNMSAPTVRTLDRIVKAFGTTISYLYGDMENISLGDDTTSERVTVIHKTDRKKLVLGPERAKAHYEPLTPDYRRKLQIMYIH